VKRGSSMLDRWNRAWDAHTIRLVPVPKHFLRRGLEGADDFSRRVVRQFTHGSCIFSEEMYERLLRGVSEFGYCVESPTDWEWHAPALTRGKSDGV